MHILITGAAGMIGRKLTARLVKDGKLNGQPIDHLTLIDVVAAEKPAGFTGKVDISTGDLAAPGAAAKADHGQAGMIFHLAGVVSGEAETDFDKGYHVNLDGTRALLEAIRAARITSPRSSSPRRSRSIGAPFPPAGIPDEFHLTPLTSYGTQKAISELLLADYNRRGIPRRRRHSPADDLRASGQAQQGGIGVFLRHHPRTARRPRRRYCRSPTAYAIPTPARAPRSASSFTPRG